MTSGPKADAETVRTAEIVASLSLATDLGMGFPFEHGFHATLIAARLADVMGLDRETTRYTYYACLMAYVGCTTDAYEGTTIFAGPQTENVIPHLFGSRLEMTRGVLQALPPAETRGVVRAFETVRRIPRAMAAHPIHQRSLCEVAETISGRMGLPAELSDMFHFLTERWDGTGRLGRAKGDDIPLPLRISEASRDIAFQVMIGGQGHAVETLEKRAGRAFDPNVIAAFVANADHVLGTDSVPEPVWNQVLAAEPKPHLTLEDVAIDRAAAAIADFSDLLAPSLIGHSSGVADLASRAASLAGLETKDITNVRRAAQVHDVGRVGINPAVWEKAGPLTRDETEQVRLHPYQTERVLAASPFLAALSPLASSHHEYLDGSGYHRGVTAQTLSHGARLIAAADTLHALTERRAHRPALGVADAAQIVVEQAKSGKLDPTMVQCVVQAVGEPRPVVDYPAGLTQREVEILGLVARGLQTKQIAHHYAVSPKTVDTHIQASYRKIGVSTRAAAALYAMEHGLVTSGELPIYP